MDCGNAAGHLAPLYVNYKAEKLWDTLTINGPSGCRYNRTKSVWFDSQSFEDWFISLTLPVLRRQEGPKAVIFSSHISVEVIGLHALNNMKFIALLQNTTHLLQPLDIAYFHRIKIAWRAVLDKERICNGQ